jgi:phospholipase C
MAADPDRVTVEIDATVRALDRIEHVVVLMLENRSFDHMLGYLSLDGGRDDVDGLRAGMFNEFEGQRYVVAPADSTALKPEQDPCHSAECVEEQLRDGNSGFVRNYVDSEDRRGRVNPDDVMRYHRADHVPVYDFLAKHFSICDRWFSSAPAATFPNRLYAIAGRSGKRCVPVGAPVYCLPSFVRHLDAVEKSWNWFVHDLAPNVYAVDRDYAVAHAGEHICWFGGLRVPPYFGKTFLQRARDGDLPHVSWIDPDFVDFGPDLKRGRSNDDHPPADILAGQELVLRVYQALASGGIWQKTLLLITYDEHGGFYDHVAPPSLPSGVQDPDFYTYGVRVPALVVSPLVPKGRCFSRTLEHASIIKTILVRFCRDEAGAIPDMGPRVTAAEHLGHLLTQDRGRAAVPVPDDVVRSIALLRAEALRAEATPGVAEAAPEELTDFQRDYLALEEQFRRDMGPFLEERGVSPQIRQ